MHGEGAKVLLLEVSFKAHLEQRHLTIPPSLPSCRGLGENTALNPDPHSLSVNAPPRHRSPSGPLCHAIIPPALPSLEPLPDDGPVPTRHIHSTNSTNSTQGLAIKTTIYIYVCVYIRTYTHILVLSGDVPAVWDTHLIVCASSICGS